jgi:endoglycosylceramidase
VAAAVSLVTLCAAAWAGPTTPLGHSGRWITDAQGRVVILHGVNMVFKRPPYYPAAAGFGEDDAAFLAEHGFNAVRLGVIYAGVEPNPGNYDGGYLNQIAATESALARHGIFSQLDFHQDLYNERFQGEGWPDWAVQDDGLPNMPQFGFPTNYFAMPALIRAFDHFWANDPGPGGVGLQDRYAAAWGHVASRFASAQHTVGFDLMNEPWPGTPWTSCFAPPGCPLFDTATMAPFYQRVIAQIRRAEPQKLVWYEPNVLFNFGADSSIPALGDPAAGFSFHVYCVAGTIGIAEFNGLGCDGLNEHVFQNADKYSATIGAALMLTEFGATDDLATIRSNVDQADRHLVSWEYWHYCECQDPTTSGSGVQAIVVDASQPPTGSNVKREKLDVLSQPYPQVVAGTPLDFDYDETTRQLEVSYSTRAPNGRKFTGKHLKRKRAHHKRGSHARSARKRSKKGKLVSRSPKSVIFIGADRYPGGYRVTVKGGGVASKPNAPMLKVVACPGRSRVDLTVRPAASRAGNRNDCKVAVKKKRRRGRR